MNWPRLYQHEGSPLGLLGHDPVHVEEGVAGQEEKQPLPPIHHEPEEEMGGKKAFLDVE